MAEQGGCLYIFASDFLRFEIPDRIEQLGFFTQAIITPYWQPQNAEICLISLDSESIQYVAIAHRGAQVATTQRRIKFTNIIIVEPPLKFKEFTDAIKPKFRQYFTPATVGVGGRIPNKTWIEALGVIKEVRPDIAIHIEELVRLVADEQGDYDHYEYEVIAQEKDAFGLALDIFKANRGSILRSWIPSKIDQVPPFLKGLSYSDILEDVMILHDSSVFGDWEQVVNIQVGATIFGSDNARLTVMYANRTPIEKTLGVDLLYFHDKYSSWIMVQYKRMNIENGEAIYRPNSDQSYQREMQRMIRFLGQYPDDASRIGQIFDYRLHPGLFYFKLCPRISFTPLSSGLIKGMYLPLDYWNLFLDRQESNGPRGGKFVSYKNIDRHINNTLFIQLVQSGWVGSRTATTKALIQIVRELNEVNHAVVIAQSSSAYSQ